MKTNLRHERILGMLARNGTVSVEEFVRELGVSVMTIRRDLAQLSRDGKVSRTHGGAVLSRSGVVEFAFREQAQSHAIEKHAIAQEVATLVKPGMAIALDTGTTTLELARMISGIENLTVVTNSLAIGSVLHANSGIEVILLGGTIRRSNPDLVGALAEDNLARFHTHLVVHGADAVTREGVFSVDVRLSRISRAMVENTEKVVLAVDGSKFQKTALVKCLSLSEVHVVVTDDGCPPEARGWLEEAVADVRYVRVERPTSNIQHPNSNGGTG